MPKKNKPLIPISSAQVLARKSMEEMAVILGMEESVAKRIPYTDLEKFIER